MLITRNCICLWRNTTSITTEWRQLFPPIITNWEKTIMKIVFFLYQIGFKNRKFFVGERPSKFWIWIWPNFIPVLPWMNKIRTKVGADERWRFESWKSFEFGFLLISNWRVCLESKWFAFKRNTVVKWLSSIDCQYCVIWGILGIKTLQGESSSCFGFSSQHPLLFLSFNRFTFLRYLSFVKVIRVKRLLIADSFVYE